MLQTGYRYIIATQFLSGEGFYSTALPWKKVKVIVLNLGTRRHEKMNRMGITIGPNLDFVYFFPGSADIYRQFRMFSFQVAVLGSMPYRRQDVISTSGTSEPQTLSGVMASFGRGKSFANVNTILFPLGRRINR